MLQVASTAGKPLSKEASRDIPSPTQDVGSAPLPMAREYLRLTITDIPYPLYLTNNNFEVEWCNGPAKALFEAAEPLSDDITARNIFKFLCATGLRQTESWDELIHFHLAIAKNRLPKEELRKLRLHVGGEEMALLEKVYDDLRAAGRRPLLHTEINLAQRNEAPRWHDLYASFFREGVVFAYVPSGDERHSLLQILSRREVVIRDLLKKRRPYLTPLAVVVADLQSSVKICAELPPEEYFELINSVWSAMEPLFRKYYGTQGKHVGDGIVCYFFPQPDCNYLTNALHCAFAMKQVMKDIDTAWRHRKNWGNQLVLNIGVHEGQEWFGTFETTSHLQFTVLGETINFAARLSDFARDGAIWVTKNLLSKLTPEERERVRYGIRRRSDNGPITVSNTYARIADQIDLNDPKSHKLRDIATLTVTEILDMCCEKAVGKADSLSPPVVTAATAAAGNVGAVHRR
jgi:class 3 adenylate cyclase